MSLCFEIFILNDRRPQERETEWKNTNDELEKELITLLKKLPELFFSRQEIFTLLFLRLRRVVNFFIFFFLFLLFIVFRRILIFFCILERSFCSHHNIALYKEGSE